VDGRPGLLWSNGLLTGNHVECCVPVDDENTLRVMWHFSRVPRGARALWAEQHPDLGGADRRPCHRGVDHQSCDEPGFRHLSWAGPRHRSLAGISRPERPRHRHDPPSLSDDIEAITEGKDPKAIIRDPPVNRAVMLLVAERATFIERFTRADLMANALARRGLRGHIF
jgi:5,5'-dehydrodivanillate O-demethylase